MLTHRAQEWIIEKNKKNFYYLDIDDEWSMIAYNDATRRGIEGEIRRIMKKVDLATTFSIELKEEDKSCDKVFFLPNAVDVSHYVPSFIESKVKTKEKTIEELQLNIKFLKYEKNDPKVYLTNLDKVKEFKKPVVGSISGLAGNWSDFAFMSQVEELLPSYFTLVSSGNIHPPTHAAFFEEHERYMKSQRMIYLGFLDYSILPDFLELLDVGIVMHRMDEFNKHSAPNKIWAYLAMGLPVICTDFLNEYDKKVYEDLVKFAPTPDQYVEFIINEYQTDNIEKKMKRRVLAERYSTFNRAGKLYKLIIEKSNFIENKSRTIGI